MYLFTSPARYNVTVCWYAGDWEEDAQWTASLGVGWDARAVRALVDGLIEQYGQDR